RSSALGGDEADGPLPTGRFQFCTGQMICRIFANQCLRRGSRDSPSVSVLAATECVALMTQRFAHRAGLAGNIFVGEFGAGTSFDKPAFDLRVKKPFLPKCCRSGRHRIAAKASVPRLVEVRSLVGAGGSRKGQSETCQEQRTPP